MKKSVAARSLRYFSPSKPRTMLAVALSSTSERDSDSTTTAAFFPSRRRLAAAMRRGVTRWVPAVFCFPPSTPV